MQVRFVVYLDEISGNGRRRSGAESESEMAKKILNNMANTELGKMAFQYSLVKKVLPDT
jgi:hypothetical protein